MANIPTSELDSVIFITGSQSLLMGLSTWDSGQSPVNMCDFFTACCIDALVKYLLD